MPPRRRDESLARRLKAYRNALEEGLPLPVVPTAAERAEMQLRSLDLPVFPYHRDPVASGSIVLSEAACQCCGRKRVAMYRGRILQLVDAICPWCIADGSAFDKFDATFIEAEFGDANSNPIAMPEHYRRDVFGRTVGFSVNNPITWWVHCDEPAEYVTRNEPYDIVFQCRRCEQRQIIEDWD